MSIVYLNREFLPQEEAKISPTDRGFLFGDGIYEAMPFYQGQPFAMEQHWKRLQNGLEFLRINFTPSQESMLQVFQTLLQKNQLDGATRCMLYLQITRGTPSTRNHAFPTEPAVTPTVYAFGKEIAFPSPERWNQGFTAALEPDRRWGRVDIKTINLLPNVLAYQDAKEQGYDEAILHKDGVDMEGSHTNLFIVLESNRKINGSNKGMTVLATHPCTHHILPGITRAIALEEARKVEKEPEASLVVEERPVTLEELRHAKEVFMTSTTSEIKPVVSIDGKPVGDGKIGPVTRRLSEMFTARIERETGMSLSK